MVLWASVAQGSGIQTISPFAISLSMAGNHYVNLSTTNVSPAEVKVFVPHSPLVEVDTQKVIVLKNGNVAFVQLTKHHADRWC